MDKIQMTHDLADVVGVFEGASFAWGIGGGWAIDLHLGEVGRRPHADVDVVCLQREADAVRRHLARWDLHRVVDGEFDPWTGALEPAHQVWARPSSEDDWAFEVLFEAVVGNEWHFRRNPDVTLPADGLFAVIDGVPTVHLGVALLYKAKRDDDLDLEDLLACLPVLGEQDCTWLAEAVESTHGSEHRWVKVLIAA